MLLINLNVTSSYSNRNTTRVMLEIFPNKIETIKPFLAIGKAHLLDMRAIDEYALNKATMAYYVADMSMMTHQVLDMTIVPSINSPHMQASPPITSLFCS